MKKILIVFDLVVTLLIFMAIPYSTKTNNPVYFKNSISFEYEKNNNVYTYSSSANPAMSKYFKNLKDCMGRNISGSCGYIAISNLLCYFDTFYNDSIIPSNYDYQKTPSSMAALADKSPGIRTEPNLTFSTISEYTNFIRNNANTCFESFLITLAMDYSDINYYNQYNILNNDNDLDSICALTYGQTYNLLDFYIDYIYMSNYFNITSEFINAQSQSYPYQNNGVINYIKSTLDLGYPVIVCTEDDEGNGHSQVVHSYEYDSQDSRGYVFYANMGMVSWYATNSPLDSDSIVEAYALIPTFTAQGSNNYKYFLNSPDLHWTPTSYDLTIMDNSRNLWYDYFGFTYDLNLNNTYIRRNNFDHYADNIVSVSYKGIQPNTFYFATAESYDTEFIGTTVYDGNSYMIIFDDINPDLESDYCDLNACARFSINSKRTTLFNQSFYINDSYQLYRIEIYDYLYAF